MYKCKLDHAFTVGQVYFFIFSRCIMYLGSTDGAVVRALASYQCGSGSIPRLNVTCWLSLLVVYSALRGFSPVLSSLGVQGWRSGESTRLPPMWPGFDSQIRLHMWVEFVGSLLSTERFFSGFIFSWGAGMA